MREFRFLPALGACFCAISCAAPAGLPHAAPPAPAGEAPAPPLAAEPDGGATTTPSAVIAAPVPPDRQVFTAIDTVAKIPKMFVWDEALRDVIAITAVGNDLNAGGAIYLESHIAFEKKSGGIFSYDMLGETISQFNDINQVPFATRQSITGDGKRMTFVGNPDGLPGIHAATRGFIWIDGGTGTVAELPKVNEIAARHGGLARIRQAGKGSGACIFSTLDGLLFLYHYKSGYVRQVVEAAEVGDGFAFQGAIASDATRIAWVSGKTPPRRIFIMDIGDLALPGGPALISLGLPWLLEDANMVMETTNVTAPKFGSAGRIYFEAFRPEVGVWKAFRWDPVRGVETLSILNAIAPDEDTIYSGTGAP